MSDSSPLKLANGGRGVVPHQLSEAGLHLAVALDAGGEDCLRQLVRLQVPSLVGIDNLGKLKPGQGDQVGLQAADQANREVLAQVRAAVNDTAVQVVVIHDDDDDAYELLRVGHVDAVEQAQTPANLWRRNKVEPTTDEAPL